MWPAHPYLASPDFILSAARERCQHFHLKDTVQQIKSSLFFPKSVSHTNLQVHTFSEKTDPKVLHLNKTSRPAFFNLKTIKQQAVNCRFDCSLVPRSQTENKRIIRRRVSPLVSHQWRAHSLFALGGTSVTINIFQIQIKTCRFFTPDRLRDKSGVTCIFWDSKWQ